MARPSKTGPIITQLKDKSVIVMDCGASHTMTGSLLNTRDVIEKTTNIETADGKESLKASYTCCKTYFLCNRAGEIKPIAVQAIFVMGLPQDLLGGKSLNQENIRVILDKDSDICGGLSSQ